MATGSESVVVKMGLDKTELTRGLSGVKGQFRQLGESVKGYFKELGSSIKDLLTGPLGAAALVGGAVAAFQKIREEMDRIGKLSGQTGLGVKFIQNLANNADLAGADIEALTKGYAKFNKELRLGNSKEAADALAKIGLSADELKSKSPEEVLQLVAKGITEVGKDADRQAVAVALFGRSGSELIPTFEALARNFEEVNGLSRQQIRDIEEMNDAWTRLENKVTLAGAAVVAFFAKTGKGEFQQKISEALQAAGVAEAAADKIAEGFDSPKLPKRLSRTGARTGAGLAEKKKLEDEALQEAIAQAKKIAEARQKEEEEAAKRARPEGGESTGKVDAGYAEQRKQQEALSRLRSEVADKEKSARERDMSLTDRIAEREKEINRLKRTQERAGTEEGRLALTSQILDVEKEVADLKEKQRQEQEKADKERQAALEKIADKEKELAEIIKDQGRLIEENRRSTLDRASRSLEELAGGGGSTRDKVLARQVQRDEERARRAKGRGDDEKALEFLSRADAKRGRINGLSSDEKDPGRAFKEAFKESERQLADIKKTIDSLQKAVSP